MPRFQHGRLPQFIQIAYILGNLRFAAGFIPQIFRCCTAIASQMSISTYPGHSPNSDHG
jgi:hypothetical protein